MKLNKTLTKDEQISLTTDADYSSLFSRPSYYKTDLPAYVKEAMKKSGVIRDHNGNFVKIRVDKTMNI